MVFRFVIVAYAVGLVMGLLGLAEWLGARIARVWLSFLVAGLLSCCVGVVGSAAISFWRRINR
jgi:hypothetical protein